MENKTKRTAELLGKAIRNAPEVENYLKAKAIVDSDEELSLLIEEQARIQSRLQSKQSEGSVIAADLEQLQSIQQTVNMRIDAYLEAQRSLYQFPSASSSAPVYFVAHHVPFHQSAQPRVA